MRMGFRRGGAQKRRIQQPFAVAFAFAWHHCSWGPFAFAFHDHCSWGPFAVAFAHTATAASTTAQSETSGVRCANCKFESRCRTTAQSETSGVRCAICKFESRCPICAEPAWPHCSWAPFAFAFAFAWPHCS